MEVKQTVPTKEVNHPSLKGEACKVVICKP